MDQPGVEFSLTYFDNPGLSIPSAFASWVAMSGKFVTIHIDSRILISHISTSSSPGLFVPTEKGCSRFDAAKV
jgi:hypothetical protein